MAGEMMAYRTLISTRELNAHMSDPNWVICDCRFSLADTQAGRKAFGEGHIPSAQYVHLDEDLSGPIIPGKTGRHPLPDVRTFATWLGERGIDKTVQVVAYDDKGGAIAARLWWMLRWMGHENAAVLDGGITAWIRDKLALVQTLESRQARSFKAQINQDLVADTKTISQWRTDPDYMVIDARGTIRYTGEKEPIDRIGGHIPGAISAPFIENLDETGHFHPVPYLRKHYLPLMDEAPIERTAVYCGSGVTAALNILAMEHAGFGRARLYLGSWSEWITDNRPIANGESVFGD